MPTWQISVSFCSSSVSDSRNHRCLIASPLVDVRVSELFKVLDAAEEYLPSNSVCKACSQKVEKLLKFGVALTVY